ncbi:uncharacterized protein BN803_00305 [Firmicutes bacterium CAG:882]|nr:uncharacterized protein BN803_00305 [Firmicutes bacterium CAG:882]
MPYCVVFVRKNCKKRRITFIACLIYCMSMYRLINIYVRAAVGEYTAMTFLPFVLYGLYRIYEKYQEKLEFADVLPLVFGVTGFNVVNTFAESSITLPIYYYKGYIAYDSVNGKNFCVMDAPRKTITVIIPEGYSGRINVRFKAPVSWRVAEVISFVSLLGIVGAYISVYKKKKVSD